LTEALKGDGRGGGGTRRTGLRGALVVAEVAIALPLLVGAGLLLSSFWRLLHVNPGFDPQNVLSLRVNLPASRYSYQQAIAFHENLQARLQTLPGVRAASASWGLPLSGFNPSLGLDIEGLHTAPGARPEIDCRVVMPDYFHALGIRLVRGRDFTAHDDLRGRPVVIINEALARRFFPNQDPIGRRIRPRASIGPGEAEMRDIVGVVSDIKHRSLATDAQPEVYVPYAQLPISNSMMLLLRTETDPHSLVSAARAEVHALDKDLPIYEVRTLDQYFSEAVAHPRFNGLLLTVFACVALILTTIGLFGVMSYSVTQRTHEIGIRTALGAQSRDVLKLVVKQGMTLALIGVAIGLITSLALTRLMKSLLFGVGATDPATFVSVALLLTCVALLACYVPARRATKVDPMIALRCE
jgi:putative ABC transport system permease protein